MVQAQGPPALAEPTATLAQRLRDVTGYLVLSRAAMREAGAAAQTLGAFYRLAVKAQFIVFHRVVLIADIAGLPSRTVRHHIELLVGQGWLDNLGRQKTRSGWVRRTVSYRLSQKARRLKRPYAALPGWLGNFTTQSSVRFVYAILLSEHCRAGADGLTQRNIMSATGLSRMSVSRALNVLERLSLIRMSHESGHYDLILPAGTSIHASITQACSPPVVS